MSGSNVQKTPVARTLNEFAERKVFGAISQLGKALPAQVIAVTGAIVTVKFLVSGIFTLPQIQVPIAGPQWSRPPTQIGDQGVVYPADTYIGEVSGLGGGTASFVPRANMATLTFFPIGNKNWAASENPNAFLLYGPDGVILRDTAKTNVLTVSAEEVTLVVKAGRFKVVMMSGQPMEVDGSVVITGGLALGGRITAVDGIGTYGFDIETAANVVAGFGTGDKVGLQTHTHTQPNDGHGDVEGPTSAPTAGT